MKYKCIKPFSVPYFDGDGMEIENKDFIVEKGSIWEISDESIIGGEIHLENDSGWLEITNEEFKKCFKQIKENK